MKWMAAFLHNVWINSYSMWIVLVVSNDVISLFHYNIIRSSYNSQIIKVNIRYSLSLLVIFINFFLSCSSFLDRSLFNNRYHLKRNFGSAWNWIIISILWKLLPSMAINVTISMVSIFKYVVILWWNILMWYLLNHIMGEWECIVWLATVTKAATLLSIERVFKFWSFGFVIVGRNYDW